MLRIQPEPLPSFIVKRYSPCVYCYITPELLKKDPRCISKIRRVWKQQNTGERIIFPIIRPSFDILNKQMKNVKAIYRGKTSGFYFGCKNFKPTTNKELETISYLRQALFEFDFLSVGNFFDIPCSVLYFSVGDEMPYKCQFPVWCKNRISSCSGNAATYDEENLSQTIKMFIGRSMQSRVEMRYETALEEFRKKPNFIKKKQLADAMIINGNFKEAHKLLSELKNSNETGITELMPSILLTYVCMSIAIGEVTQNVANVCKTLIDNSRTYEQQLLAILIHFWLTEKLQNATPNEIEKFINNNCAFKGVVNPFLKEQTAMFHSERRIALEMFKLADVHLNNDMKEHSVRCLWQAFSILENTNTDIIKRHLLHEIAQSLFREEYNFDLFVNKFAKLFEAPSLEKAPITATYFALMEPKGNYRCNFIKISLINVIYSNAVEGPIGFDGDWLVTSQRLFGFTFLRSFGSVKSLNKNEVAVGDKIEFIISVNNNCSEFPAGIASLMFDGFAESTTARCEFHDAIKLTLTVKGEGEIVIRGVKFFWCEKINLFSEFIVPIKFFVPEGCPRVSVDLKKPIYETVAGKNSTIAIKLNTETPLNHISVMASPHLLLINPRAKEIGGIYQIGKTEENEMEMTFLFSSPDEGDTEEYILTSYATESKNIGFKFIKQNIRVFERISKEIPQFPAFFDSKTNKLMNPPFTVKPKLCGTTLSVMFEATEMTLNDVLISFEGFVVGKTSLSIKTLQKGTNYTASVQVLSTNELFLVISFGEHSLKTNLSRFISLFCL